jgi:hypothetical protein
MDIMKRYEWKVYSDQRKFIIDIILHTDMAKHFSYINDLNSKVKNNEIEIQRDARYLIMGLVHAVDIGAQGKPFYLAKIWSMKILAEFFA